MQQTIFKPVSIPCTSFYLIILSGRIQKSIRGEDVLLVCWRESAGARLEWAYAEKIGKEIVMAEQGWIEEYLERVETVTGIE